MSDLLAAQRALAKAHEPMAAGETRVSAALPDAAISVDVARDGIVPLPAEMLRVVLTHLFKNAAAHGASQVTLSVADRGLTVTDNGPGVSKGNRDRIFDPFFTTRRSAGGTGMGLSIVKRMLDTQGANITLLDGPGARFRISW